MTGARRAKRLLSTAPVSRMAAVAAAVRRHALVVLFHRVGNGPSPHEVVPTVDVEVFRNQVEALCRLGDVVPLDEVGHAQAALRPRIALTFDDDYASHVEVVLPVLRELGLPATFFVGGRGLHQLGPYWWEVLERRIATDGVESTGRDLGIRAQTPAALAAACEGTPVAARLAEEGRATAAEHLDQAQLRTLAAVVGVSLGFHTLHHPVMTQLGHAGLRDAVTLGRDALEEAVGRHLSRFAYPHGKGDPASAAAARDAGFTAAYTGRFGPVRPSDHPFLLGRWEPLHTEGSAFTATACARLHRTAPAP